MKKIGTGRLNVENLGTEAYEEVLEAYRKA